MVEYQYETPPLERLGTAIAEALDEGVTQQELMGIVLTTVATYTTPMQMSLADEADCEDFQVPGPDTVYTELPPGLIDIRTASQKYCLQTALLRAWVRKGRLSYKGRLKAPAAGGGYIVVDEEELTSYISAPKDRGGRPRKTLHDY